jgi:hypothetical protein
LYSTHIESFVGVVSCHWPNLRLSALKHQRKAILWWLYLCTGRGGTWTRAVSNTSYALNIFTK